VVGNTYDDAGNLTGQEGTGADAPTEARSFGYDLAGRLTSASAPGGTDTFGYDDRGLLLAADGPSGASSFGYDGQARMTSRTDAAGTATYAYDNADRLAQMADPSTGVDLSFTYNAMSQVSRIAYGPDGNTRTLGYDSAHRLASDTLAEPSGSTIASIAYGYDPAGDLTSKTTTGMAGATTHTYGYDYAGRLTSWDNGTTTVGFTYDNSGNRTSAGGATFTYDARNQLVTANGSTYTYTPRGTIASVSGGSGKVTSTSDAFDQTITDGDRSYSYDSIGRLIQTATSGTIDRTLSYTGQGNGVASDGSFTYSRDPGGQLVGEKGSGDGVLAWTDQHTDVVGQFSASGTLSGSTSYDPFGTVLTSAGMLGNLGFQSGWTDPSSDKVNMLARWYNPGIGQFTSRDSVGLDPVPSSVSANRVAYVNDSPLDDVDPSGHCGRWAVWCNVKAAGSAVIHKADQALDWSVHKVEQAWDWGVNKLEDAWNWADQQVQHAYDEGKKIENKVVDDAKHAASTFISTVHDAAHQVAQQAHDLAGKVSHAATKIANETVDLAGKAGKWIDEHKKQIIAGVAGLAVGIGVFAGCMALSLGVGSVGCAAIAGAAGGAVAGAIGCPAGMSKVKCAAIGAAGGAVAGAVGAIAVPAIAAGAAALGAGSTMAGIIGGSLGGALAGATGDITSQLIGTGKVDWTSVATSAAIGGVMGGIGGAFGGCHSFAPTTKVWMANGTAKAIKDVKLGDKVTATDPTTGKTTQQAVVALHDNHDTDLADVTVTGTDHRMSVVRTTQHHLFWDATAGAWIAAADLVAGHQLRSEDGSTETVAAVHSYTAAADMRDLTVDTDHTYYVIAGDEPVLVHNCGGGVDANGSPCACSSPRPITATIDAVEHPDAAIHAYEQGLDGAKWTVDRPGAEARRATSLRGTRTVPGFDRDELPPAVVEEGGAGAHVKPIVPRDNRGSGSSAFGAQIRDVPDGGTFIMRIENLEDIGVQ